MAAPIVMAWDLAGRVGVACGPSDRPPRAVTIDLGVDLPQEDRLAKMLTAASTLLSRHRPDVLVYEAPVGGPQTSHFLVGLVGCFVGQARALGFLPRSVSIREVRNHFLGWHPGTPDFPGRNKGEVRPLIKRMVRERCSALGWAPRDDDEADALALWDFGVETTLRTKRADRGPIAGGYIMPADSYRYRAPPTVAAKIKRVGGHWLTPELARLEAVRASTAAKAVRSITDPADPLVAQLWRGLEGNGWWIEGA